MYVVSKKEGGVRFVTLRCFSMGRVSGRRSRSQMSQADYLFARRGAYNVSTST